MSLIFLFIFSDFGIILCEMYSDQTQDPIYFYIKNFMYQLMTLLSTRAQRYAPVANIQVIMNEYGTGHTSKFQDWSNSVRCPSHDSFTYIEEANSRIVEKTGVSRENHDLW